MTDRVTHVWIVTWGIRNKPTLGAVEGARAGETVFLNNSDASRSLRSIIQFLCGEGSTGPVCLLPLAEAIKATRERVPGFRARIRRRAVHTYLNDQLVSLGDRRG